MRMFIRNIISVGALIFLVLSCQAPTEVELSNPTDPQSPSFKPDVHSGLVVSIGQSQQIIN